MGNPELFKVNGNTHEERLLNLCTLVAKDDECSQALCSLPTSADAAVLYKTIIKFLQNKTQL